MTPRSVAALAAALALAGCEAAPSVAGCTCDAECGAGNACYRGACVVNAAPSADFEPPAGAATHRLVGFAASTFDPEGSSVTARWAFRAVAEGCEPEPESVHGDRVDVVFWCPGRYEATLVPVDAAGLEGAAIARAFDVAASLGAPSVVAGPPVPARHRCDLAAPRCAVLSDGGEEALPLEAVATDPGGETLRFEWRALPPPTSEGDPTLRVTFLPDPFAPAPTVAVENGGGPIAGTWRLRVRAFDPGGLIGEAVVTVEVANLAPYAAPTAASLPHRYDGGAYVAEGEARVLVVDPDGDAVTLSASVSDPPPSCAQSLEPTEGGYRLAVSCTDPAGLIGPARSLLVAAIDVHGASLQYEVPVTIENRPPAFEVLGLSDPGGFLLDHAVGPCTVTQGASCFFAEGSDPFLVSDPDGDPVGSYALSAVAAPDRPAATGATWLHEGVRRFRFEAPVDHPLEFRSADGTSPFTLAAAASDPWEEAGTSLAVRIGNRAPVVVEPGPSVAVDHRYDPIALRYLATAPGPRFADPDGDPLSAAIGTTTPCQSATLDAEGRSTVSCERAWDWRSTSVPPLAAFAVATTPPVIASDGWDTASAPARINILDRPPIFSIQSLVTEGCECDLRSACPLGTIGFVRLPLLVSLMDPDGDPARVTPAFLSHVVGAQPPVGCRNQLCQPYVYVDPEEFAFGLDAFLSGTVSANTGTAIATDTLLGVRVAYDSLSASNCP